MEQKKSIFVSNAMVLGKRGEKFSLSYEKITFLDNGCFDIYGDGTLTIDTLVNQKDSDLCPYEIRVIGNRGEDGCDSMHGEDGGEGKEGIPTEVEIRIGALEDSIRVISVGGEGGRGGSGLDGLSGGDGGDAAPMEDGQTDSPGAKGGQGGDGSPGKGRGGKGGKGGKGPAVKILYGTKAEGAEIQTSLLCSKGGAPGRGGKGGRGGRGGKNSDGSCAKDGKDGRSCTDGQPGQAGEKGEIAVGVWETGGINHES